MITEDYVSFETAKLLKEKGFDANCPYVWVYEGNSNPITKMPMAIFVEGETFADRKTVDAAAKLYMNIYELDNKVEGYLCPTINLAMKWLRKEYNILIVVDYEWECDTTPYYFKIYRLDENGKPKQVPVKGVSYDKDDNPTEHIIGYRDCERSHKDFSSYEEACEAAIKYCLENLI